MPRLIFQSDQGKQSLELGAVNNVGRHPESNIQLLDTIVSKQHCVIEQRGAVTVLRDLGSMNGTFINGQKVAGERRLYHGDEIRLGNTVVMFEDGVSVAPVALPPMSAGAIHHSAGPTQPAAQHWAHRAATGPVP